MTDLVIFGVGKVADVLYRYIAFDRSYTIVGFTCDAEHVPADGRFHGLPVVPFAVVTASFPPESCDMLIAVGYHRLNSLRASKFAEAKAKGYRLASYVSSRAFAGDWLEMGENCIVLDNVGIEPGARPPSPSTVLTPPLSPASATMSLYGATSRSAITR
jgi:hypothetical protein